jgi:STE24 endopeptidase
VVAHELGHEKHGHVRKMIAVSIPAAAGVFYLLSLLLRFEPLYAAFGFAAPSYHALLVLLGLCSGPLLFFLKPLFMVFSRRNEFQADRFARQACGGDPGPQSRALIKLYRDNLSNLHPHPLYSLFNYSHPTLMMRLAALEKPDSRKN